jgi:CRISPR/Cas system-associated exonuclease Cas4 (RecB family)
MSRPNTDTLELVNPEVLDHDFADLILRPMSWSRSDCYTWCPKQYMYKYVEFKSEGFSAPLALGSAVHDALEKCIKYNVSDPIEIEGWFQGALEEHDKDKLLTQVEIDDAYNWLFDTLYRMQELIDIEFENVIDVEWGFKYALGAGLFTGYIDLLFWDEDDEGKFIHLLDYKTGNNYDKNGKKKKSTKTHGQTMLYAMAVKSRFPGHRVKASLYWTRHVEVDTYEYTDKQLATFTEKMRQQVCTMMADSKYRPTSAGIKCAYCDFARDDLCRYGMVQAKKFSAIANARKKRQRKA